MIQKAIDVMNEAFAADPAAIHALLINRVPCNQALTDHPTIQVDTTLFIAANLHSVGLLGILNGVLEPITGKRIASNWSDVKNADGRHQFLGFVEYKPNK